MRTIAIGDIHGAYKCLEEVLKLAGPADRVILLGDYVDGLPQTKEVLEFIDQMDNAILIRGNHDQWALDWLLSGYPYPANAHWTQGGRSTFESLNGASMSTEDKARYAAILQKTIPHFVDEHNRVFTHGGFNYLGIADTAYNKMWDRSLIENAYRLKMGWDRSGPPRGGGLPPPYCDYKEIYVGHTATKFFTNEEKPANWLNLWAMDTNCGWGGPLVAIDVDTKQMFYSKPALEHYPEYKGR